ncbi:hypothetical protein DV736_g1193, partial [Chaetothyriales sp. CBS 134916]
MVSPIDEKAAPMDIAEPESSVKGTRRGLLMSGSAVCFCCLGFPNSFGAFEEYYLSHQLRGKSPDDIAWIGSLSAFLQFFAGMLGGPLFDRFGAWIIRPAAILYIFAMMMLSLCKEYWQIMLVQGVLMGITMVTAFGIVVSGSSIGGIAFPIAISKMLNSSNLGFGWSVRVVGFIIIPFMAFACIKARVPPRTTTFWIGSAFKELRFCLLVMALFFMFVGMFMPMFYIPTYAVSRGMDPTLAGYLFAILNGASTFGRIIPGVLADKYGRLNMFGIGGIATGVTVFCMNSAASNAAIIVYYVFFGFGTHMGMGMSISAIGLLIGPPINRALVDRYHGFSEVSVFSGVITLVEGIIALATKLATPQGLLGNA